MISVWENEVDSPEGLQPGGPNSYPSSELTDWYISLEGGRGAFYEMLMCQTRCMMCTKSHFHKFEWYTLISVFIQIHYLADEELERHAWSRAETKANLAGPASQALVLAPFL